MAEPEKRGGARERQDGATERSPGVPSAPAGAPPLIQKETTTSAPVRPQPDGRLGGCVPRSRLHTGRGSPRYPSVVFSSFSIIASHCSRFGPNMPGGFAPASLAMSVS